MRIAVCISGMPRQVREGRYFTQKSILAHNDCDIFIHAWDSFAPGDREVADTYQPKLMIVQPTIHFAGRGNSQSMWYSMHACNELKSEYERSQGFTYDAVLRHRFDLAVVQPISINHVATNTLYVPVEYWGHHQLDDRIAYGSSEVMNKYADVNDFVTDEKTLTSHAELMLMEHIRGCGIRIVDTKFDCFIAREPGYPSYPYSNAEEILKEART